MSKSRVQEPANLRSGSEDCSIASSAWSGTGCVPIIKGAVHLGVWGILDEAGKQEEGTPRRVERAGGNQITPAFAVSCSKFHRNSSEGCAS